MDYKDYYKTLGVAKDASQEQIQKAFRKLARKFHPDVNKTRDAEARFKEINEAYEVLKDADKRSKYDRFGSAWKQAQQTGGPPPGFEDLFSAFGFGGGRARARGTAAGAGGFSSFFEMLFGGANPGAGWGGGFGGDPTGFATAGADQEANLVLGLEEAARGGTREIAVNDGSGPRSIKAKIPAGVRNGQRIRLAGQGAAGPGGQRGNLYLKVDLLPHPHFRLDGEDLHTVLRVSPWEAALGGVAELPTLEGPISVKIPTGASSGKKIRLRQRGWPRKEGRGDLLAELRIVLPDSLTEDEEALFRQLADRSEFTPRGPEGRSSGRTGEDDS